MFFLSKNQLYSFLLLVIGLTLFQLNPIHAQNSDSEEEDDPVQLFNKAQDAHEKGDLQTALKFYDEALKIAPDFPEAEYQRATIYISLGKNEAAEKSLRHAGELRADWSLPIAQLGALLVKENRFTEAEPFLQKAVKLDAQNFPAYVALTELRLKTKAPKDVLANLLVQLKTLTDGKARTPASVWSARAAVERTLGDSKSAKMSLSRALELNGKDVSSLLERAELSFAEKDFGHAAEDTNAALKLAPDSLDAKLLLARIADANGNADEAIKILDSLNEIEKKLSSVVNLRGEIQANNLQGAEAIAGLEKILANEPKNVAVLARLCNLSRTVNPLKALDYCRRAAELEPNNLSHAVGYGAALVQAKQFESAVVILRRILGIAPENYTAHANLAAALSELGRFSEAITEYNWIIADKPDLAITYFLKAIAHDKLGEFPEALANYQKFLQLADAAKNQLEIDKVNLRLPSLTRQIKNGEGKKPKKS